MRGSARLRLAVNVGRWNCTTEEFDFLCTLLPDSDAEECRKFRFFDDQKRAVTSRLLQRHAAFLALGIPPDAVVIKRTKGRKPYIANDIPKQHAPNFNYSVSHEGDYVILASESVCICGCDVAAPHQLRRKAEQPLATVLSSFSQQLTTAEWAAVNSSADESGIESRFRQFWSLKEAYVKATGEGLGFDLRRCAFEIISRADDDDDDDGNGSTHAQVLVDGEVRSDWAFFLHQLGNEHWVSVARAPVTAIVDAWGGFKATLQLSVVPSAQHAAALVAPEPPFTMLLIANLVPEHLLEEYEAAGGDVM